MVGPESRTTRDGQTSRDIYPEDEGQPEIQQDDVPTQQFNEDPQFAPLPDEQPRATVDWGTTAFEQSQGEPADVRLDREVPDTGHDVRPAEDPDRRHPQLEQDLNSTPPTDSGTERTADDLEATADPPSPYGGDGPEEGAVHVTDA
jgi:hypothetical protein